LSGFNFPLLKNQVLLQTLHSNLADNDSIVNLVLVNLEVVSWDKAKFSILFSIQEGDQ